jgi:hypothetical protein
MQDAFLGMVVALVNWLTRVELVSETAERLARLQLVGQECGGGLANCMNQVEANAQQRSLLDRLMRYCVRAGEKVLDLASEYLKGKRASLKLDLLAYLVIIAGTPTLPFSYSMAKLPVLMLLGTYLGDSLLHFLSKRSNMSLLRQ